MLSKAIKKNLSFNLSFLFIPFSISYQYLLKSFPPQSLTPVVFRLIEASNCLIALVRPCCQRFELWRDKLNFCSKSCDH